MSENLNYQEQIFCRYGTCKQMNLNNWNPNFYSLPWTQLTWVTFDTETSGANPIGSEIVELGATKWQSGKIIDRFETLLRPREPMSDFIIGIHGISNEEALKAPLRETQLPQFREFIDGSLLLAHHAPFDMGFLIYDFEQLGLSLSDFPVFCTSLLARKLISGTPNHKLQTLVKVFGFPANRAHRALDDAESAWLVFLECMKKLEPDVSLEKIQEIQGKKMFWKDFSISNLEMKGLSQIIEAIKKKSAIEMKYDGADYYRSVRPNGIVRNPDGDYLSAYCEIDHKVKRFMLAKISF